MIFRTKQYVLSSLGLLLIVLAAYAISIELNDRLTISQAELINESKSTQKPILIDVRHLWEYQIDHLPNSVNAPYTVLLGNNILNDADKDELIVVYCENGVRSRIALAMLKQAGYKNIKRLDGDIAAWRSAGLPLIKNTKNNKN